LDDAVHLPYLRREHLSCHEQGRTGTFFKDKALRLFIPLLVAVFTYARLQVYLERITHGQFSGSFFAFLPHYFEGVYMGDGSAGNFAFVGMHMWYVFILLSYCLMFYSLFRWWKGDGRGVLEKIGNFLASPWTMWLTLALPFLVLHIIVSDTDWELGSGGWPFLYYIFFLLYGFATASHERLQANIKRMRWFNLALGAIFSAAFIIFKVIPALAGLEDALGDLLWILGACSLLPAFLGFGMQHLTFNTPFLKYASEAVMGFYILHQTVLLVIGYLVVRWNIPDFAKWAIIAAASFVVITAICEFLIRRITILRFLCGMKPTGKVAVSQPAKGKIAETA
jgi:peptidoglycan/LPS O-acetylase OafA/YrhL